MQPKVAAFKWPVIYSLLAIQFGSGACAYAMDFVYPFTPAKASVDFLRENGLEEREIVSVTCEGTAISAYLERKVWFLCDGGLESYCRWQSDCVGAVADRQILEMITRYMQTHDNAILVSYLSLDSVSGQWHDLDNTVRIRQLARFDQNIVDKTGYHLFELERK